jgi:hypothetical protein
MTQINNIDDLFEASATMLTDSGLPPDELVLVLSKLLVALCLNTNMTREQFTTHMAYVYDMENFLRPKSDEVH